VTKHHDLRLILDRERPIKLICRRAEGIKLLEGMRLGQMDGSTMHAAVIKNNFGIKSFYPKIGGMC
jgi:hypothetical protein